MHAGRIFERSIILLIFAITLVGVLSAQPGNDSTSVSWDFSPERIVDDRAGLLSDAGIAMLTSMAKTRKNDTGIQPFVITVPRLPDNFQIAFDVERTQYLVERGIDVDRVYVLIISIEDRKVETIRGAFIDRFLSSQDLSELQTNLAVAIADGNYVQGIGDFINNLPGMPSIQNALKQESGETEETESLDKFIEFEKRFDDRAGVLSEQDLAAIKMAAEIQETETGLKAYLLIMPKIDQWDFDEFGWDQFNFWKSQGHLDNKSYLIIIALENFQMQVSRGKYIDERENDFEILKLRNDLQYHLKEKKYRGGIIGFIEGLSNIPSLKKSIDNEKKMKEKSMWYMLIGIIILISVFMRMGYKRRMEEQRKAEMRKQKGPFIE